METEAPRRLGEMSQARKDIDDLMARVAALESARTVVSDPPTPPPIRGAEGIPESLQKFAAANESPDDFRLRAFRMLQRLGIKEGEHGPDTPPLSVDEKINLIPMLVANFKAGNWLNLEDPQGQEITTK